MVDTKSYLEWFDKASDDIKAAKVLVAQGEINNIAGFHVQQAIEKCLKAFLIKNTGELPEKKHNLVRLSNLCHTYEQGFERFNYDFAEITRYYIKTRYPVDNPLNLNKEQVSKAIKVAEDVFSFAKMKISDSK